MPDRSLPHCSSCVRDSAQPSSYCGPASCLARYSGTASSNEKRTPLAADSDTARRMRMLFAISRSGSWEILVRTTRLIGCSRRSTQKSVSQPSGPKRSVCCAR